MKKNLFKMLVLVIIWGVLLTMVINRASANDTDLTISINTGKDEYKVGEDVEVTIRLNKDVMTSSFYLNYDSSVLTFKQVKEPSNVAAKDYPSDNLVRVVYADMTGEGVDSIKFVFTVKAKSANVGFSLSNTSMTTSEDNETYSQGEITGIGNTKTITTKLATIESDNNPSAENPTNNNKPENKSEETNKISNTVTNTVTNMTINKTNTTNETNTIKTVVDNTTSNTAKLPNTGKEDVFKYLLVALVMVTIYLGYNAIKYNNYLKF